VIPSVTAGVFKATKGGDAFSGAPGGDLGRRGHQRPIARRLFEKKLKKRSKGTLEVKNRKKSSPKGKASRSEGIWG